MRQSKLGDGVASDQAMRKSCVPNVRHLENQYMFFWEVEMSRRPRSNMLYVNKCIM
jgi:hypothetical protein